MKLKTTYEIKDGYLHVRNSGRFALDAARDAMSEWINKAQENDLNRVLCDVRDVTGFEWSSVMTRFKTGRLVADSLPQGFRLAIWLAQRQTENSFVENVMVNRNPAIKLTANYDEALEWLGVAPAQADSENKSQRSGSA